MLGQAVIPCHTTVRRDGKRETKNVKPNIEPVRLDVLVSTFVCGSGREVLAYKQMQFHMGQACESSAVWQCHITRHSLHLTAVVRKLGVATLTYGSCDSDDNKARVYPWRNNLAKNPWPAPLLTKYRAAMRLKHLLFASRMEKVQSPAHDWSVGLLHNTLICSDDTSCHEESCKH